MSKTFTSNRVNGIRDFLDLNGLDYYFWYAIKEKVYQGKGELTKGIELVKKWIRHLCLCSINMAISLLNAFDQETNASLIMKKDQSNSIRGNNVFARNISDVV